MGFTTLEAPTAALAADVDAMTAVVMTFPIVLIRWCRAITVPPSGILALQPSSDKIKCGHYLNCILEQLHFIWQL